MKKKLLFRIASLCVGRWYAQMSGRLLEGRMDDDIPLRTIQVFDSDVDFPKLNFPSTQGWNARFDQRAFFPKTLAEIDVV